MFYVMTLRITLSLCPRCMDEQMSSMSNLQMISPINLQSADVVNLFHSSNLLLSQLSEVVEGNFVCVVVCACVYVCV